MTPHSASNILRSLRTRTHTKLHRFTNNTTCLFTTQREVDMNGVQIEDTIPGNHTFQRWQLEGRMCQQQWPGWTAFGNHQVNHKHHRVYCKLKTVQVHHSPQSGLRCKTRILLEFKTKFYKYSKWNTRQRLCTEQQQPLVATVKWRNLVLFGLWPRTTICLK